MLMMHNCMASEFIVRVRGLPFACTEQQLREWFEDHDIEKCMLPLARDGRASGEGFIKFKTQESYDAALKKDRMNMGSRYIEVFPGSAQDKYILERPIKPTYPGASDPDTWPKGDHVVRLRGLPFETEIPELIEWLAPIEVKPSMICLPVNSRTGRKTGDAFVAFNDRESAEEVLKKDRHNMAHRYIEVFKSSQTELASAMSGGQDEPVGRGGAGGPMGRMRGNNVDDYYGGGRGYGYGGRQRPTPYDRPGAPGPWSGGWSGWGSGSSGYGASYDYPQYGGGRGGDAWSGYGGYGERDPYAGDYRRGDPWSDYQREYDQGANPGYDAGYGAPAIPPRVDDSWRPSERPVPLLGNMGPRRFALRMRGIPFRATEQDVYEFFGENRPSVVEILFERGRALGEARVEFPDRSSYDQALTKDKQYMGSRYVELLPDQFLPGPRY